MHCQRDIQKIKAIRSNDSEEYISFRKMRNSVNQNIFRGKESNFKDAFPENKGNSKETWKIIKELTSKNRIVSQITEIDLNGDLGLVHTSAFQMYAFL